MTFLRKNLYPKSSETRVGGKQENPLSLEILSDWGERVQPYFLKPSRFQK